MLNRNFYAVAFIAFLVVASLADETIGDKVDEGSNKASSGVQDAADAVKNKAKEAEQRFRRDTLGDKLDQGLDSASESVQNAADSVKESAKDAKYLDRDRRETVGDTLDNTGEAIKETGRELKYDRNTVGGKIDYGLDVAGDKAHSAAESVKETAENAKNKAGEAAEDVKEEGKSFFEKAGETISNAASTVKDAMINAKEAVIGSSASSESSEEVVTVPPRYRRHAY